MHISKWRSDRHVCTYLLNFDVLDIQCSIYFRSIPYISIPIPIPFTCHSETNKNNKEEKRFAASIILNIEANEFLFIRNSGQYVFQSRICQSLEVSFGVSFSHLREICFERFWPEKMKTGNLLMFNVIPLGSTNFGA